MFGSEYEYIKEYKPTESEIIETKQLKENVIDELLDSKQNKPIIKDKKLENKEESIKEIKQDKKLINSNKLYGAEFENIKEYKPFEGELKGIKDIEDNIPEKTVDIKLNKISKDKSPEEEQFNIYQTPKKDKKQDILIRTLSKKVVKVPEKISLYDRITLRQSFGKWKELNEYYGNINQKVIDFSIISSKEIISRI